MKKRLLPLLTACVVTGQVSAQTADEGPAPTPATPLVEIGHGINLGNFLEAPKEGDWGQTLQAADFPIIKQAGFKTIRGPIRWWSHVAAEPAYAIDPVFMSRIDWAVAQAKTNGLQAIL